MKNLAVVLFVCAGLLVGAPAARAQDLPDTLPGLEKAPPFVADVSVTNQQVKGITYRMYYIPGRMRLESIAGTQGGEKQIIISHLAQNVSYVDIAGQWYKVSNEALGVGGGGTWGNTAGFRTQKLGRKVVDGKLCDGYRFTSPRGDTQVEQWMWGDYPILATVNNKQGVTTAKYLSLRAQTTPDSYFMPPAGAKIQDLGDVMNPSGGMGGMPGGLPQGVPAGGVSQEDLQKMLQQIDGHR